MDNDFTLDKFVIENIFAVQLDNFKQTYNFVTQYFATGFWTIFARLKKMVAVRPSFVPYFPLHSSTRCLSSSRLLRRSVSNLLDLRLAINIESVCDGGVREKGKKGNDWKKRRSKGKGKELAKDHRRSMSSS